MVKKVCSLEIIVEDISTSFYIIFLCQKIKVGKINRITLSILPMSIYSTFV